MLKRDIFEVVVGQSGCGQCSNPACCRELVQVTNMEIQDILKRHRLLVEELKGQLLVQAFVEFAHIGDTKGFFRATPGCAFLDGFGKCRIYDDRPVSCALYCIASFEDPSKCRQCCEKIAFLDTEEASAALFMLDIESHPEVTTVVNYHGLARGILIEMGIGNGLESKEDQRVKIRSTSVRNKRDGRSVEGAFEFRLE